MNMVLNRKCVGKKKQTPVQSENISDYQLTDDYHIAECISYAGTNTWVSRERSESGTHLYVFDIVRDKSHAKSP